MNLTTFRTLASDHDTVPVSRRLLADVMTPVSLFLSLREGARYPFLFESVEGGEQLARYSFLGRDPYQILRLEDGEVTLEREGRKTNVNRPYFDLLRELTTSRKEPNLPDLPPLTGGAVGYSSYDTVREVENLPNQPDGGVGVPDAIWAFYDEIVAFDHVKKQLVLIKTVFTEDGHDPDRLFEQAQQDLDRMQSRIEQRTRPAAPIHLDQNAVRSNVTRDQFMHMVERGKEAIYEGDIFQIVLSQRFEVPFEGDRFMLYRALRVVNPSPYLFYLDFDDFSLIGSSPEVLVQVNRGEARLLPIAGTRPRGKSREEDLALEKDLLSDPKEIAEHIMLVDLGRNDLSRVCKPGTVRMERRKVIERYSHVMHIVSEVTGQLQKNCSPVDALMQCFPAGTVSGAPKIRAMELIDELEPTRRGPYAGAVGYFDFSGNMDTCIAIRTMVATRDTIYIQAGAGVVADSRPEREFEETREKAGALIEALGMALKMAGPQMERPNGSGTESTEEPTRR
ncbi:MAG: anthranilate synthase component I [Bacteroidota bacterium]